MAGSVNFALAVYGVAQSVNNTSQKLLAYGHIHNIAGSFGEIAFLDLRVITEDYNADKILLQIQRHRHYAALELNQLSRHTAVKAVYSCNAVADHDNITCFNLIYDVFIIFYSILYNTY